MNKQWDQNLLLEELGQTIYAQFSDLSIFQDDGASYYESKVITEQLKDENIKIFDPWPYNSQDPIGKIYEESYD